MTINWSYLTFIYLTITQETKMTYKDILTSAEN